MTPTAANQAINLARQHHQAGRLKEAETIYRQILTQNPNHLDALHLLGVLTGQTGQLEVAEDLLRRAIRINPRYADAYNNLGNVLSRKGQRDEAIACFRQAISLKPNFAEPHNNLGIAFRSLGQIDEAIAAYQEAIRLKPDYAEAFSNLGNTLKDIGQLDHAIASHRQAIQLKPNFAGAYNNLGNVLIRTAQHDEAIASYRHALRLKPNFPEAHSGLVKALNSHSDFNLQMIHEELHRWSRQHAEPLKKFIQPHPNNRDPNRRLRIGYVSPDLRDHVVGQNLLPLLREHDHKQFEIFCYADLARDDAFTDRIRSYSDTWRSITRLSDSQAADLIRQDQIDILVDLMLHTANNRLLIFAFKPAPVQLTYLGYCGSTGLETMDYRLSDPYLDPPDSDLSIYTERTIRLPETYWCYGVAGPTPDPSPPPAETAKHITFGSLNSFTKVSPPALDLWSDILQVVPKSRLILHSRPGKHLQAVQDRFTAKGISPDRLEFSDWKPWPQFIQTYGRIDIALDTFPWGGGITTCDALWMGVPVVTLTGQTPVGRGGASILANVGLPELIAHTPQQYIQIAAALANDLPRLLELRRTLRPRMQTSPLMNASNFARQVEAAYRQMWQNWSQPKV